MSLPVPILNPSHGFPDPRLALRTERPGLVAMGGDLSVNRLLLAYRSGIFPWSVHPLTWWSPDPRGILELEKFHVPRSLARALRRTELEISFNRDFRTVIGECARLRAATWISPEFIRAYVALHEAGHAHSVEVWIENRLVGGVYGVAVGGLFAGESMFHAETDASKIALFHLVQQLRACGFLLFDLQMITPVTQLLGASEVTREEYLHRLARAIQLAPLPFARPPHPVPEKFQASR